MLERTLIGILSIGGFLISLYFALSGRGPTNTLDRFVPEFCRIGPEGCKTILDTKQARLFGVPNYRLGILYYIGLFGSAFLDSLWKQLHVFLFFGSVITIFAGFYLSYVLVVRLKIYCTLCFISHGINLTIFFILLAAL